MSPLALAACLQRFAMPGHVYRRRGSHFAADIDEILSLPAKCPWTGSYTYLLVYAPYVLSDWGTVKVILHGVLGPIGTCTISAAGQLTRLFAMQGLRIDESTAMYYLKESGGDLKKAVKLFGVLSSLPLLSPHCSPLLLPEGSHELAAASQHAAQQACWWHVMHV